MTILRAQKPDGTFGELQMDNDGNLLVADGEFRASDLLDYPHVGMPKTSKQEAVEAAATKALHYLGAGQAGVVRSIWFILLLENPNLISVPANAAIKVWTGLGDIADPDAAPNEETYPPDASISLVNLLGTKYDASGVTTPRLSDFLESKYDETPVVVAQMTFPIPFENGILLQFQGGSVNSGIIYSIVEYESIEGSLPVSDFSTWRLRSSAYSGTLGADAEATILNVASGPGMLAGLFTSIASSVNHECGILENNWKFKVDGSQTVNWQTSGCEDLFGQEAYYFTLGVYAAGQWGCYYLQPADPTHPLRVSAYRLFTKAPVIWNDGMVGTWDRVEDSAAGNVILDTTILYYAP